MRKTLTAIIAGLCTMVLLVGCSGKNYEIGENGEFYNDYIIVKKYKGLEVEKVEPLAVTDEDVEASVQSDLETEWEKVGIKDRAAKDGDTVIIDFVGKKDGVAFEGGSASNSPLTLGSKKLIVGFEAGIVGHTPGETFDLDLTFPETYGNADLAGQAVVFTVTLDAIVATELTEEMVPSLSSTATTIEEYKAEVRKNLEKNNEESANEQMKSSLLGLLYEQCKVTTYPEEELKKYTEDAKENYTAEYQSYVSYVSSMSGITAEEFEASYGMTVDEYVSLAYGSTIEDIAKMRYTVKMAVDLVAEVEEITVTEEDINAYVEESATQKGYEPDTYRELFVEQNGEDVLKEAVLQDKVIDVLWEHCKVVEPKATDETTGETTTDETTTDETTTDETTTDETATDESTTVEE